MSDKLDYVKEKMDEGEFYSVLAWGSIKATIVMILILFAGYVLFKLAGVGVPGTFWVALPVTYIVMLYVFRSKIFKKDDTIETLMSAVTWFIAAIIYSGIMYVGGEIIFIGLVILGIFVMVIFLGGDVTLTAVFTYRDLLKWVESEKKREEYMKEQQAAKAAREAEKAKAEAKA